MTINRIHLTKSKSEIQIIKTVSSYTSHKKLRHYVILAILLLVHSFINQFLHTKIYLDADNMLLKSF